MKIRNGFVSNSSSSSFVVLTTPKNLENIKANASDAFKEFIDVVAGCYPRSVKIHGMELVDLSRVIHDSQIDGWSDDSQDGHGGYRKSGDELWSQLIEEIERGGGYVQSECCG